MDKPRNGSITTLQSSKFPSRCVKATTSCPLPASKRRPSLPPQLHRTTGSTSSTFKAPSLKYNGNPNNCARISSSGASITGSGIISVTPEIEVQGIESATSSSTFHGVILIGIMISFLAAFICSQLTGPCDDVFFEPNELNYCTGVSHYFSIINILSVIYAFVIYFLHLIGQCDYVSWFAKRRVALEILGTVFIMVLLVAGIIIYPTQTKITHRKTQLFGTGLSFVGFIFYCLRVVMLIRETRMLLGKPQELTIENGVTQIPMESVQENCDDNQFKNLKRTFVKKSITGMGKFAKSNGSVSSSSSHRNSAPVGLIYKNSKNGSSIKNNNQKILSNQQNLENSINFSSLEIDDDVFVDTIGTSF